MLTVKLPGTACSRGAAPTIYDVARIAEVSFKTVSRVVNNDHQVRPATRARVQQVISALRYRPNVAARRLAGSRSFNLALLIGETIFPWLVQSQLGMVKACREAGYQLILEHVPLETTESHVIELVLGLSVDGVILLSSQGFCNDVVDKLKGLCITCVLFDPTNRLNNSNPEIASSALDDLDDDQAFLNGFTIVDQVLSQIIETMGRKASANDVCAIAATEGVRLASSRRAE